MIRRNLLRLFVGIFSKLNTRIPKTIHPAFVGTYRTPINPDYYNILKITPTGCYLLKDGGDLNSLKIKPNGGSIFVAHNSAFDKEKLREIL